MVSTNPTSALHHKSMISVFLLNTNATSNGGNFDIGGKNHLHMKFHQTMVTICETLSCQHST